MSNVVKSPIQYYNNIQLNYFGKRIKKTMLPIYSPYVSRHTDELIKYAEIKKTDKILDVGCGMGKYTLDMLKKGYKVEGLDLSPFLLQQFLRYNNNMFQTKLHAADILEAPEELNETFDVIVGYMTLHHLHILETSFQAIYRLLKPGGKVIFLEPNPYNPLFHLQIWLTPNMNYEGEKGLKDMRCSKVYTAMEFAGFENCDVHRFGLLPPVLYNNKVGRALDHGFTRIRPLQSAMAFQLFKAQKPD